ncbi:MAG: class I SAM-dependent RNA methyltransferase [Leptonema sp. (in: bacteria)]
MNLKKAKIDKILSNLEGLIHFNQKEYSLPYVLPGDEVEYIFTKFKRKKKILPIKVEKNNNPLIPRETPQCTYYELCGGCKGQHIPYSFQWEFKIRELKEKYLREFPEIKIYELPAKVIYHYRNRMDFVINQNLIGLRKRNFYSELVDIEECKIQSEIANQILKLLRNLLQSYPIGFDRNTNKGILKYITLRTAKEMGIILTIFKENKNEIYNEFIEKLILSLKENFIEFSLFECYTDLKSEVSNTENNQTLYGKDSLNFSFDNAILKVPPEGFFQPNPKEMESMLRVSIDFFLNHRDFTRKSYHLIDLFCGVGLVSLYFSKYLSNCILSISGFEISERSVHYANQNFESNSILYNFTKFDLSKKFTFKPKENTLLILDPPRSGLPNSLIRWILKYKDFIEWIVYISCNPKKQSIEIESFKEYYKIEFIIFGDPFPQTEHWESLLILRKRNSLE